MSIKDITHQAIKFLISFTHMMLQNISKDMNLYDYIKKLRILHKMYFYGHIYLISQRRSLQHSLNCVSIVFSPL